MESPNHVVNTRYSALSNAAFIVGSVREYDKALLVVASLHAVFSAVMRFVPILLPKYVIDELTRGGTAGAVLGVVLGFGLVILIAESISKVAHNKLINRFIVVRLRLIARSGKKFMSTDYENLEDPDILDLSQRGDRACNNNANGVEGVMHRLLSIFGRSIVLFGSGAIIATLHPLMLALIAGLLAINFAVSSKARKADKAVSDSLSTTRRRLSYITDRMSDFSYGKDIRLFGMKRFLLAKHSEEQSRLFAGETEIQRIWLRSKNVYAATGFVQEAVVYAWLCWRVVAGAIGIGDFVMYIAAIRAFSDVLNGLLDDVSHIRQQNEVISDFRAFLDLPDKVSGTERLPSLKTDLECTFTLENVSFRYPRSESFALKDVSLTIRPGERLAIVGLNGAGKTTFVKLLTRLYDPTDGRILLNGADIRKYDRKEYHRLFSVVFQDIHLFAFSVAENVSMQALDRMDKDRVISALEQADLGSKVQALPKGIDTTVLKVVDEGGVEFSGGESQKLALARALYKNAPVVILDEPTAALDALAEAKLYADFDGLIGNRTAIYISHRLASTRFCDRVAVFEDGELIETGTHEELMQRSGRYAELFSVQAKYYQDGVRPA